METDQLLNHLTQALRQLILTEWDLAVVGANERTVTSHLSRIMHELGMPPWLRVDHDYNRHLLDTKRAWLDATDAPGPQPIVPDIVVHQRGVDNENLLALEAKRARRCEPIDEAKIRALVASPYNYRLGVLLGFGITTQRDESWWQPAWCWLASPTDEVVYCDVFPADECEDLNASGQQNWTERL